MKSTQRKRTIMFLCLPLILAVLVSSGSTIMIGSASSIDLELKLSTSNLPAGEPIKADYVFSPLGFVYIMANATYANQPQANLAITFKVVGPTNISHPIIRTALTGVNGIAAIDFRIPMDNVSNPVIGLWSINCTAKLLDQTRNDTSSFRVGRLVDFQSVKLFDENGTESTSFSRGQNAKIEIAVAKENSQPANSNLIIDVTDSSGVKREIINENRTFDGSFSTIDIPFLISNDYSIGETKIDCSLNTPIQGLSVQRSISKNFTVTHEVHDIIIKKANISSTRVEQGDLVNITVTVSNKQKVTEQTTIHYKYADVEIGSLKIQLNDNEEKTVDFAWNTSNTTPGTYRLTTRIDPVQGENETSDNELLAGTVTITERSMIAPILSATSLYVFALFVVGLTTFSLLAYLRWRNVKPPIVKTLMPIQEQAKTTNEDLKLQSPIPEILKYSTDKTLTVKEVSYASTASVVEKAPLESVPTHQTPIITNFKVATEVDNDKITDELIQVKLQSIELLPLSGKAIDLCIQKIQLLRGSKANREQLQQELTCLEKILELQTKAMEVEIAILKDSAQKLIILSKGTIQEPTSQNTQQKQPKSAKSNEKEATQAINESE